MLAAVVGALLLNATLPLEIDLMFRAIGRPLELSWLGLYLTALLVAPDGASVRRTIDDPLSARSQALTQALKRELAYISDALALPRLLSAIWELASSITASARL